MPTLTDAQILMRFAAEIRPHIQQCRADAPVPPAILEAYAKALKPLKPRYGRDTALSLISAVFADTLMDAKAA